MTDPTPSDRLLDWYDRHRRTLPWRAAAGTCADPYHVWLSEIMLQQTTVVTVIPYFQRFLARWPTIHELAAADLDDVLTQWQGLGYYARARNLHKCAQVVSANHGGEFPTTESALLALPGIGAYTAAALTSIAFDKRAVVVDGNVERVVARLFALTDPLPGVKKTVKEHADRLTPDRRPGDHAQAMMDLGATVCTPTSPKCDLCPILAHCLGRQQGIAADLPRRAPRKTRPTRHGVIFWLQRKDGAVLLRRRPPTGLLGGMMELPGTDWREGEAWREAEARQQAPTEARWRLLPGSIRHTFTHFHLVLTVMAGQCAQSPSGPPSGTWVKREDFGSQALPTVMRKAIDHAMAGTAKS
ncbi:A/G-specific adenine glycosylase [Magnetospira sp. QH-2]|uniref:A/G-specific adenine glycosylase n=1 Tax=Magnetospira sp. (strain QH-2) TaxID=1288970 RepID=UPI0003E80C54|nr:A/G-specific adenine glycosylase [Magnetospira sp. QH-2]CCQ72661.1 adenine glycosylase mutY [Magnetospira sp. QH-2]